MGKTSSSEGTKLASIAWTFSDALKAILLALLGSLGLVLLVHFLVPPAEKDKDGFALLLLFLVEGLLLLIAWTFTVRKYRCPWSSLGFSSRMDISYLPKVGLVLLCSLGFSALYVAIVTLIDVSTLLPPTGPIPFERGGLTGLMGGVGVILFGPVAEETFFRGFLLKGFLTGTTMLKAIVLSSLVFGLSHGVMGLLLPATVSGVLFGWLFLRTGSIWPPILAHAVQNTLAYVSA